MDGRHTGAAAGSGGLALAAVVRERMLVADNWRVFLLQVVLGPVREEVLFRGYLIQLLLWSFRWLRPQKRAGINAPDQRCTLRSGAPSSAWHQRRGCRCNRRAWCAVRLDWHGERLCRCRVGSTRHLQSDSVSWQLAFCLSLKQRRASSTSVNCVHLPNRSSRRLVGEPHSRCFSHSRYSWQKRL